MALEKKMDAPRADTTAVGPAQGPVGHPFQQVAHDGHQPHRHDDERPADEDAAHLALQPERKQEGQAEVGAQREEIPVGEVDKPQYAVDHSIAKRDEGVDAPDGEPVGQLMKKFFHTADTP